MASNGCGESDDGVGLGEISSDQQLGYVYHLFIYAHIVAFLCTCAIDMFPHNYKAVLFTELNMSLKAKSLLANPGP